MNKIVQFVRNYNKKRKEKNAKKDAQARISFLCLAVMVNFLFFVILRQ